MALFICELFNDALSSLKREKLWERFGGFDKSQWLNVVVLDGGSSTLNVQVLSLVFDEDTEMVKNQSNVGASWRAGSRGGSHLMNQRVREFILPQLHDLAGDALEGEVAHIMQQFEREKRTLDYTRHRKAVTFTGTYPHIVVRLSPAELQDAGNIAFDTSLETIEAELEKVAALGRDLVVLSTGDSFCQPGMRRQFDAIIRRIQRADAMQDCQFKHGRLQEFDPHWYVPPPRPDGKPTSC